MSASRASLVSSLWGKPKTPRVQTDFDRLLDRMRQRHYPETLPALAFYWLKTVYSSGYVRGEWRALDGLLQQALSGEQGANLQWRRTLNDLRNWIRQAVPLTAKAPPRYEPRVSEEARPALTSETLVPYIARLLNEWLPVEVARLLVAESDCRGFQQGGIPVLAVGRALERLLLRERLSAASLEALLHPELLSPRFVYPADLEILRDVALFLLGRTDAPAPAVLPAALLSVAPDAQLFWDHPEAVRHAVLADRAGSEELHVPIAPEQATRVLRSDQVRIPSIVVTMDGRWWQAYKFQGGGPDMVAYRPMGRLRIDYSGDHVRVRVPWPEARLRWPGPVFFADRLELFGRQWRVSHWEQEAGHTWLHLVFDRALPLDKVAPSAEERLRRSRPAAVDMAWAALEGALALAFARNSRDPVELIRHGELIPVGRAVFSLVESVMSRRLRKREMIETRLRAIRYLEAELEDSYGRVPWRIVPEPVRRILLAGRWYQALGELLHQVFEGLPEAWGEPAREDPGSHGPLWRLLNRRPASRSPSSPPRAA